jgi:hypothetical protein
MIMETSRAEADETAQTGRRPARKPALEPDMRRITDIRHIKSLFHDRYQRCFTDVPTSSTLELREQRRSFHARRSHPHLPHATIGPHRHPRRGTPGARPRPDHRGPSRQRQHHRKTGETYVVTATTGVRQVTIESGGTLAAPAGYSLTMTVNGIEMGQNSRPRAALPPLSCPARTPATSCSP